MCKILGYTILGNGMLTIAKQSLDRLRDKIRKITKRNRGASIEVVIAEINKIIPGWVRYFKLARCTHKLEDLDGWIRRKLRCYRLKQLKRTYTIMCELRLLGVPEWQAWICALSGKGWWRKAGMPQTNMAMSNNWLKTKGLISACAMYQTL